VRNYILAIALLSLAVGNWSCKKQTGNVIVEGQNTNSLQPFQTDTFTLFSKTIDEDSMPGNNLSYLLIGAMNDPLFGYSRATAFAKSKIIEPLNNFPNTLEPDSALLFIPMVGNNNFYGNRSTVQKLLISVLAEGFNSNKIYYQTDKLTSKAAINTIYTGRIFQEGIDSIGYKKQKIKLPNGLLIKLSKDFARYLQQMPTAAYQTTDGLNKYLPGISIQPIADDLQPGEGGYGVFDFKNEFSIGDRAKILLYYSDTQTFVFGFDDQTKTLNYSETGPYKEEIVRQLVSKEKSQEFSYVQSLSGTKNKIEIPYIYNLIADGNIAINKAEIVFHVADNTATPNYYAPPRLNLFQPLSSSSNRNSLTKDGGSSTFGGLLNEKGYYYKFDVTRQIQGILSSKVNLNKEINNGLLLTIPTDVPVSGSRVVIDNKKTRLIVTYTKPN
jgi:hypothetical protein